ncbi:MAG: cysteine desulfurase [Alphaproteobacteria bacterium]|nr:cysteine desulfurase [Alphaproteobacteria bacterium]
MARPTAYLDCNATAPVRPEVAEAVSAALREGGNASSVHGPGRRARARIEAAREAVKALVGAARAELVFTSGGSEANALALCGLASANRVGAVLIGATEHPSAGEAARSLGLPVAEIPVGRDGVPIAAEAVARVEEIRAARGRPLVALMLANNETGVLAPVAELARAIRGAAPDALIHCDAVQAAGKIPVDFAALGVDSLSLSAHKLGGPQGVGALVLAEGVLLAARQRGGGQEKGYRAGTENGPGIAGFGRAAELCAAEAADGPRLAALRDRLEAHARRIASGLEIAGAGAPRLPNTSALVFPGVKAETLVMALDLAGVAVSSGSACSSGKVRESHVLKAMGFGADAASGVRVSLGWASREEEVDLFLEALAGHFARRVQLAGASA